MGPPATGRSPTAPPLLLHRTTRVVGGGGGLYLAGGAIKDEKGRPFSSFIFLVKKLKKKRNLNAAGGTLAPLVGGECSPFMANFVASLLRRRRILARKARGCYGVINNVSIYF
uniref:Uncharacterized protein n=1 Tax=Morchella importuna TaxID=1174673 RepID=A0A650AG60_9PEZI|nr:hypothetical protein [Morchella importuna]QGN66659.1 hypothetical protein [Morchella importuna]